MLEKIDHINIVVSDLENARNFFITLGFAETHSAELSGDWISSIVGLKEVRARYIALSFPGSETSIELIKYFSPASPLEDGLAQANRPGYRHLAFAVKGIETIVKDLRGKGVSFLGDIQTFPATGKKLVYFRGPEGILLELAEYPETSPESEIQL